MPRTKIIGYLMLVTAISNTAIDILNGGGFELKPHVNDIMAGLAGAGLIFARTAIQKVLDEIGSLWELIEGAKGIEKK